MIQDEIRSNGGFTMDIPTLLSEIHRKNRTMDIPTLVDCGCVAYVWEDGSGVEIEYCLKHRSVDALLGQLHFLDTAIMPKERKYDEWGYCKIHRDILWEFDTVVKKALIMGGEK